MLLDDDGLLCGIRSSANGSAWVVMVVQIRACPALPPTLQFRLASLAYLLRPFPNFFGSLPPLQRWTHAPITRLLLDRMDMLHFLRPAFAALGYTGRSSAWAGFHAQDEGNVEGLGILFR